MDIEKITEALKGLEVGEMHYFSTIGSTNDFAAEMAEQGAPDFSLVVADNQTQGRGRAGRKWHTPSGSAIALSILLRPSVEREPNPAFYTGLASLAVCETLIKDYQLDAAVKWPNDVLVDGKKVCGVLVESHWFGDRLSAVILGVGLNVALSSLPDDLDFNFPATSIEHVLGEKIDRLALLRRVLEKIQLWRPLLDRPEFIHAWNSHLAYLERKVFLEREPDSALIGVVRGLDDRARLLLEFEDGHVEPIQLGEIHLRPFVDTSPN